MRTRKHYENMLESNPGTTWGISLAAQAVYAAKNGTFDRNTNFDEGYYRKTYLRLQKKYGEVLNPGDVRNEMKIITAMSILGSRTSDAKKRSSSENAKLGGRPAVESPPLTPLQQQILNLRSRGLKIREIAAQIKRQPENVRQILARAEHKIRKQTEEEV